MEANSVSDVPVESSAVSANDGPSPSPQEDGRRSWLGASGLAEDLNFLLTNRVPRQALTRLTGWFSRIESPLLARLSIRVWQRFGGDLGLHEAKKQAFTSVRDCFVRELREGVRPIEQAANVVTSPCDAEVGACGRIRGVDVVQAKGFPYSLRDLLADDALVERYRDGVYVTLRLRSTMYHRLHAPYAGRLREVNYISGDTWNVNPIALSRVERLFCRNERAVLDIQLDAGLDGTHVTLVPVAAVGVATMRIHGLPDVLDLRYRGPNRIPCDVEFEKGDELGWFEQGSTVIVFATSEFDLAEAVTGGTEIRMGEALLRMRTTDGLAGSRDQETP